MPPIPTFTSDINPQHVPDYVEQAYQAFYETRVPGAPKLKNLSTGAIFYSGGRYYFPIGRTIMKDTEEWGHIPTNPVDTEAFAQSVYQTIDDIIPFAVTFEDAGDLYEITIDVPIREHDEFERLGETVLSILSVDSKQHFNEHARDTGHTHLRYLAANAVLPPHRSMSDA